jgi:hypothetical protein
MPLSNALRNSVHFFADSAACTRPDTRARAHGTAGHPDGNTCDWGMFRCCLSAVRAMHADAASKAQKELRPLQAQLFDAKEVGREAG